MSETELSLDSVYAEEGEKVETETTETAETEETEAVETAAEETETTEESTTDSKETEPKESWTFSQAMDEREKRQDAVRERDEALAKVAELEKEPEVSVFDDPEKWQAQQDTKLQTELRNNSLNMSQAFAEEVFGTDKVNEAVEWIKTEGIKSPHVIAQFNGAKLPFHQAVKMFDDEKARLDPEAAKAKMKAEIIAELKAETETEKEPEESITPSLASKRSAGKAKAKLPATSADWEAELGA